MIIFQSVWSGRLSDLNSRPKTLNITFSRLDVTRIVDYFRKVNILSIMFHIWIRKVNSMDDIVVATINVEHRREPFYNAQIYTAGTLA